jgi:hypothetical protein
VAGRWFSSGTPASSTNKTDRDNITAILLTVALNTITLTLQQAAMFSGSLQQKHVRDKTDHHDITEILLNVA